VESVGGGTQSLGENPYLFKMSRWPEIISYRLGVFLGGLCLVGGGKGTWVRETGGCSL